MRRRTPTAPAEAARLHEGSVMTDLSSTSASASRDLRRERLALAVRSTGDGPGRRRALTELVERALAAAWADATADIGADAAATARGPVATEGVALAVVGSVARGDAGPASDLDLVLLHDGRSWPAERVGELAEKLW